MTATLFYWMHAAGKLFTHNLHWMSWNLFLALIPLGLSFWLFRATTQRYWYWWLTLLVFIAFLPNAPYVLTDIIHLIDDIRRVNSIWGISLVLIPQYLIFFIIGFEAYVLSLMALGRYLKHHHQKSLILPSELFLHILSAIGIYLGRFQRFNSWDIVTQLDDLTNTVLNDLANKFPVLVIVISFIILAGAYWLAKQLTWGLILIYKSTRLKTNLKKNQP